MRVLLSVLLAASPLAAQGFTPDEALKRMQLPPGFTAKAVATEPLIRQPLSVSFDERGRMWVLQYLQYPNPAGLTPVKQDQYLRTVWDKVPEPPPHGPKGLDRITILSDPDANGRYTKAKDFVGGLNLATGFCVGNGGVYVVQPPYLLFYADKDQDDVPDGDPDVLLTGFGMEDTHSYANSLQWGPDGWLYGAHGSTVTARIKNPDWAPGTDDHKRATNMNPLVPPVPEYIEFQQGIWRYHPKTKRFELFAEGGGNTYGLDFDKYGRCIAGTNWGGFGMLHHVQGAYYVKGFAKHGPLHNPYSYGYFDHVPYQNFKGGHVTCGGVVYQADTYPREFHDQYIAGNLLSNAVYWHVMTQKGSTFTAKHGGDLLVANDTWFRPVDCFLGPDGSVYVADWYDKRAAHLDPIDNWDKTNGRVYRIEYQGTKQPEPFDLRKKTGAELVELLKHPNKWWRNEARRLLAERKDPDAVEPLRRLIQTGLDWQCLEALWAYAQVSEITDGDAWFWLNHPNEHVRAWAVRLIGDRKPERPADPYNPVLEPIGAPIHNPGLKDRLVELARSDRSPVVRSQLACSAKRFQRDLGLRVAFALCESADDLKDPFIPALTWWAIEPHLQNPPRVFSRPGEDIRFPWTAPVVTQFLLERVARRTADRDQQSPGYDMPFTAKLLAAAPAPLHGQILRGVEQAVEGRRFANMPTALRPAFDALLAAREPGETFFRLRVRFNHKDAVTEAHARLADPKRPDVEKVKLIQLLGQVEHAASLPVLLGLFRDAKSDAVRGAALAAVQGYESPEVQTTLQEAFPKLQGALRQQALGLLLSRAETASALLDQVSLKKIDPKTIPIELIRPVLAFNDEKITHVVESHWGKIGAATPGEKQARISWLNAELGRGNGSAKNGHALFEKHCAACHTLFGTGGKVGPDLTTADRKNRSYLLTHVVDPSLYVRPEFISYNLTTLDGRRLTGLVAESTEAGVTLVNVIENKAVKTAVAKKDIDEFLPSPVSLMPDKLLDTLSYDEVRDLFAYVQSDGPPTAQKGDKPVEKKGAPMPPKLLTVLLISGSLEYKSDESLAAFEKYLQENYPVTCVRAFRKTDEDLPGLELLDKCDVAVFFTRRLKITGDQLDRVKKYATAGKPIVAIRTASHGFQNWLDMDKEVLGGDYKGHFGHEQNPELKRTEAGDKHPIFAGVKPFSGTGGLYKNPAVAKDVTVLMTGSIPKQQEPVAWVREYKGGRIFYTSLGHPKDFESPEFVRMLTNAIFWTAKKDLPAK